MAGSSQQESFISKGTFKRLHLKKKEEERDVYRWAELPVDGAVYKIVGSKQVRSKYGDCLILTIVTKTGEESKVWAPKGLEREILAEAKKTNPRTIYFCSLGQNKKDDGSGHLKNEYESCYR